MDTLDRELRREALALYRMDAGGNPRGDCMSHLHGIADILHHTIGTPEAWEYRHPSGTNCLQEIADCLVDQQGQDYPHGECDCSWPDMEYATYADGRTGVAMLTYAGNVLSRYARVLERAGKDY